MDEGELYSPSDLANSLGQSLNGIVRILQFLTRYGFVEQVTEREMMFRRLVVSQHPGKAVRVLRMLVESYPSGFSR